MASQIGQTVKLSIFGESHGPAIGCVIDGFPAGFSINLTELQAFLNRRAPGRTATSSSRREADKPFFLSGTTYDKSSNCEISTGSPICVLIENNDVHKSDYDSLTQTPRPGHADLTAFFKYHGFANMSGGGHFSGRLTAPLCIAGGIAKQYLKQQDIDVIAHIRSINTIEDYPLNWISYNSTEHACIQNNDLPTISLQSSEDMKRAIKKASKAQDSLGGIVECVAYGFPAGYGSPMFGGIENRISQAIFGIPAVKGVEFGAGFNASKLLGSQNNDNYFATAQNTEISSDSNNSGGILGGISTGMPIVTKIAIKPTPSIGLSQKTVVINQDEKTIFSNTEIEIQGRHDPCILPRVVPVCEAAIAFTLLDIFLSETTTLDAYC